MLGNTSSQRVYNWYISLVAASCMVLYGYDASVFNAIQGSAHWVAYFNHPVSPTCSKASIWQEADSGRTPRLSELSILPIPLEQWSLVGSWVVPLPTLLVDVSAWLAVPWLSSSLPSFNASLQEETWLASSLVVSLSVSVRV